MRNKLFLSVEIELASLKPVVLGGIDEPPFFVDESRWFGDDILWCMTAEEKEVLYLAAYLR